MKKSGNGGGRRGGGRYSTVSTDYRLLEEIGGGASATVYRAIYVPLNEIVAVKCLDLDRCNTNLDDIRREAQTLSLIDHPNVIVAYCSFVVEHSLWVVMPFMAEGSCLHLMKVAYRGGFEESAIGSILKETLKALEYLHRHGHIHRDVKAGNILLDGSGLVKLGDFGVSACMFDKGDRQRARNTFVGTPCWMAPEVLQPGSGYNFKADIWSFGITALELAHGHAPFSRYPPMKVLLMTLQNAPPGLDYDRDKFFSKSFKEMVAMCLVKDQTKRPTAEKLLKHSFFKSAKPPELSVKNLLADLPPLWDRVKALQLKDAAQLALKKMPSAEKEALSQSEYQRGVSAWNFDIEDLKAQASLAQDGDDFSETKEDDGSLRVFTNNKDPSTSKSSHGKTLVTGDNDHRSEDDNQVGTAKYKCDVRKAPNFSGPLMLPYHASANSLSAPMRCSGGRGDSLEDKLKGSVVQIRGRFSVTSENVDVAKDFPLCSVPRRTSQPINQFTKETTSNSGPVSILMPHLQNILQQTSFQQDLIVNLLKCLQRNELDALQTGMPSQTLTAENDLIGTATTERERLLLVRVAKLQERVTSLTDELIAERLKHSQLQEQLTAVYPHDEMENF